ncbi:hypothetical protein VTO42DRAFT_272 [Malbranchea cinnamomea]
MSFQTSEGRKRKRTSLACDPCRLRKVRCDGRHPCCTCTSAGETCTYGTEAFPKSKSEMILDVAIRSERLLREMSTQLSWMAGMIPQATHPAAELVSSPVPGISPPSIPDATSRRYADPIQNISNAVLSQFHASSTESVLAWPQFDNFPSLRRNHTFSVFHLENTRPALPLRTPGMHPYASRHDVETMVEDFSRTVNFWYPTMTHFKLRELQHRIVSGHLDETVQSCLALLVMALGAASGLIAPIAMDDVPEPEDTKQKSQHKILSELYFDSALRRIHVAHMECSVESAQCLFFAALFCAFLQRPIQAWSFISAAATKCRLLLSFQNANSMSDDDECLRRIFWSCYILESDYLAELPALPPGIAEIESSVPLPREYYTHPCEHDQEKSSLYFLACISIRRLLNRVHNVLYAKDTGASFDDAQFPSVVSELDHQLEQWRDLLPPDFQFSVDSKPAASPQGGFLRQRYLTCRSVIYRPYLTWALSNSGKTEHLPPDVQERCKRCLDACCLHGLNLRSFAHTVMIDTWICSLSMASVMLILLAAAQTPVLRKCIPPEAKDLGAHLERLLRRWMRIPGDCGISPSVERSVELISEVNMSLNGINGVC